MADKHGSLDWGTRRLKEGDDWRICGVTDWLSCLFQTSSLFFFFLLILRIPPAALFPFLSLSLPTDLVLAFDPDWRSTPRGCTVSALYHVNCHTKGTLCHFIFSRLQIPLHFLSLFFGLGSLLFLAGVIFAAVARPPCCSSLWCTCCRCWPSHNREANVWEIRDVIHPSALSSLFWFSFFFGNSAVCVYITCNYQPFVRNH